MNHKKPVLSDMPSASEIQEAESKGFAYDLYDNNRIVGSAGIGGLSILFLEDGTEVIKDKSGQTLTAWPDEVQA